MEEIGKSVVAKVAECLVDPVLRLPKRHAQYMFCAGKIKRNLESTKEELTSKRVRVEKQKHEALIRAEIIDDAVEKWLNEVGSVMEDVGQLEEEMKEGSSCCRGWCSTLKGYRLCEKLADRTEIMKSLMNQNGEFNPFSRRAPIQDIEFCSSGNFVYFESTKLAAEQLLEALSDDRVYMIGLSGMGGCGKTTLAKEVGKIAKEKLFDHVVFTKVSQNVNVRKIQGEIADLLNFKLEKETEAGRSRELSLRLQSGQRILIILDDVWAEQKLEDIGISLESNHKNCKVLLTTRRFEVCTLMNCQRKIHLNLLSKEEAWTLFQKHMHIVDESSSTLLNVAQEVARECQGLPIAIETVARSLKGKPLDEWMVALDKLRTSKPIDGELDERNTYSCLKLSYSYLQSAEAKLLLKICSMFPEDHHILHEDLFRYGIGLGICGKMDSIEKARRSVNVFIRVLIDSSLLTLFKDRWGKEFLVIHDMVRVMALQVASEENTIIVNSKGDLSAFVKNESMKDCYAISLWHNEKIQFPPHLDAPKLQILLLNSRGDLHFSDAPIEGMKELKVMAVVKNNYYRRQCCFSLPQSIQRFNNLQTLRLVKQEIGDISFVVSLIRLQILDLSGSKFVALPTGIENLNELKLLDLSYCRIEEDCCEVIRRCSKLEELDISYAVILPYKCVLYKTFPKLQRYSLNIGELKNAVHSKSFPSRTVQFRAVRLGKLNISNSGATIKDLLQRAGLVCLDGFEGGSKSIIPEIVQAVGGMNELTKLHLDSCSNIEWVIDTATSNTDDQFPKLVHLKLRKMDNLKEVCHGPPLPSIFEKLTYLSIVHCHQLHCIFSGTWNLCNLMSLYINQCAKLTSLFPLSVAQSLLQLQYLSVHRCNELKHIILKEGENGTDAGGKEIFPNLKSIKVEFCDELECIFPISVAKTLLSLQSIEIKGCSQLKFLIVNEEERTSEIHDHDSEVIELALPKLKGLRLRKLPNLTDFGGSLQYQLKFQALESYEVKDCPNFSSTTIAALENFLPGPKRHNPDAYTDNGSDDNIAELEGEEFI